MSAISEKLRAAREAAMLSVDAMARLVGVEPATVEALEQGTELAHAPILREYATVFGTRVARFLEQGAAASPATLLFRSAAEHGTDLSDELRATDLRVLGDFLACVADVDQLERALGRPAANGLDDVAQPDGEQPDWKQGQDCAERVRERLGLGDEPIESMLTLLEGRLRWSLFFVTPDDLSSAVEGASTTAPKPAVLINLVGGRESWWRTRVNLAHEMCHVIFDSRALAQPYLLSPEGRLQERGNWELVEKFRSVERRANAFAVYFLVPTSGLRSVVGRIPPRSQEAVNAVCQTFGVGRTVAIRRLGHEYQLSEQVQSTMLSPGPHQDGAALHSPDHPDAGRAPGFRRGRLTQLVLEALRGDHIDAIEARSILQIAMSAPIPDAGDKGAPLVLPETIARSRAEAFEWSVHRRACLATEVRRTDEGWDVELECRNKSGDRSRTTVRLSASFEPLAEN